MLLWNGHHSNLQEKQTGEVKCREYKNIRQRISDKTVPKLKEILYGKFNFKKIKLG